MSDDRDRRAAEEWLDANDGPAVPPRSAVDSLAAFRAAARAEGAAEAIEACCAAAEALREGPTMPTIGALVDTMRRLAPRPGLVVVAREDLATVIEAAKREHEHMLHEVEVCDAGFRGNARDIEKRAAELDAAIDRLRAGEE